MFAGFDASWSIGGESTKDPMLLQLILRMRAHILKSRRALSLCIFNPCWVGVRDIWGGLEVSDLDPLGGVMLASELGMEVKSCHAKLQTTRSGSGGRGSTQKGDLELTAKTESNDMVSTVLNVEMVMSGSWARVRHKPYLMMCVNQPRSFDGARFTMEKSEAKVCVVRIDSVVSWERG